MTVTCEDITRTGRIVTGAQWGVASVVMAGSAASAGLGFHALGEHWAIGVITGLGVDLALASGLIIGRRLRAVGVRTAWGTVLLWLTAGMTLVLNSGAAVIHHQWALAVAHAFLPILLVVLTEAGSEAQLKLLRIRRDAELAAKAERDAGDVARQARYDAEQRQQRDLDDRRARGELVDARAIRDKAAELRLEADQEKTAAAAARAETKAEVAAAGELDRELAALRRKQTTGTRAGKRGPVSAEERREWIRTQRAQGRRPAGAEVDQRFGPPRTGAKLVRQVEQEIEAELAAVAGGTR